MMRLSELKTGESATVVKVMGYGGFRRRIMEMGFVRGQRVDVLLDAPLKDPVEYRIMGYDVSLRRKEAEMIVVHLRSRRHSACSPASVRAGVMSTLPPSVRIRFVSTLCAWFIPSGAAGFRRSTNTTMPAA